MLRRAFYIMSNEVDKVISAVYRSSYAELRLEVRPQKEEGFHVTSSPDYIPITLKKFRKMTEWVYLCGAKSPKGQANTRSSKKSLQTF